MLDRSKVFGLCGLILAQCASSGCHAASAHVVLKLGGVEHLVYQAGSSASCGATDLADGPARAVRLADDAILLMASSSENYPFRGSAIDAVRKDCRQLYVGRHEDDPSLFDDRSWLLTLFTTDGKEILGLIHNEFQGNKRPWLCPDGKYTSCWYNAVTAIFSSDDGRSFFRPPSQTALVAVPRFTYAETVGHQAGIFGETNIVPLHDGQAFLVYVPRYKDQAPGVCAMFTKTPFVDSSWRAFDGTSFSIDYSESPYREGHHPPPAACKILSPGALQWPVTNVVFQPASGTYIALMVGSEVKAGTGVFYAESRNLIDWTGPWKLTAASIPSHYACGEPDPIIYPSILDPNAQDRNFAVVGGEALLFFTLLPVDRCHVQVLKGALMKEAVRLSVSSP